VAVRSHNLQQSAITYIHMRHTSQQNLTFLRLRFYGGYPEGGFTKNPKHVPNIVNRKYYLLIMFC